MERRLNKIHEIIKGRKAEYPDLEGEYVKLYHKLYYQKDFFRFDGNGRCSCYGCRPDPNDRDTKKNILERVLDREMKEEL